MTNKFENDEQKRLMLLKATNDMGSFESFHRRMAYSAYSCYDIEEGTLATMKDFNLFENLLYGKVNPSYKCVEVKASSLVPVDSSGKIYTLPFVNAAFEEFQKEIKTAIINGKIRNSDFLEGMEVKRSYLSPRTPYTLIISMLGSKFLEYYTKTRRLNEIRDFKTFMSKYTDFILEAANSNTITFAAFMMSKNTSILSTGLALDLKIFDAGKDEEKMNIIGAPYFQYYVDAATKFGFYIDKNYPARLVANLSSPAMAAIASENGYSISGAASYFNADYTICWREDIYILQNLAYQLYSYIQARRPDIYTTFVEGDFLFTKVEQRQHIVIADLFKEFPDEYWLDFYIRIRNQETKFKFDEASLNKMIKNAIDKKKRLDIQGTIDYINKVFMDVPAQEGSLNDYRNRRYFKDQEELPFSDYQEYLVKNTRTKR